MHNTPPKKLIFLALGTCLLGFSPLIILFGPIIFPMTLYYEKYTWVYYIPSINFLLFGIALALLILTCIVILIIKNNKLMYTLTSILTISALLLFVGSALSYLKITPDGMKYRYPFQLEEQVYKWSDMEKVDYYPLVVNEPGYARYIVTFKDGETYKFNETGDVEIVRSSIKMVLAQNKVPFRNMDVENVNENTSEN